MGFHAFSLDPRTILGIEPGASLEEIHEAYREKSKKHHPDRGGDEWAFRMVARAYEVLKATSTVPSGAAWMDVSAGAGDVSASPSDVTGPGRSAEGRWGWARDTNPPRAEARREFQPSGPDEPAAGPHVDPLRMRKVDVELIWTRFEKDPPPRMIDETEPGAEADDGTLSVCMVISWPQAELVEHSARFPGGGEVLRSLIDLFDRLRAQPSIIAERSRIEDGRFVGWLSYPDVLNAQDAILTVRDAFRSAGLTIKLQTRDERIPFDWQATRNAPVMSQAF